MAKLERQRHTAKVGFPVACIGITPSNQVVLGGGGGPGRSGVQNKLAVYSIGDAGLQQQSELVLKSDEDAPTCLAVHPKEGALVASINGTSSDIQAGSSRNLRVFALAKGRIRAGKATKTICSSDQMDYQKCIRFSSAGSMVAGGATDGTLSVVKYPSLKPVSAFVGAADEINDVDFGEQDRWLAAATDAEIKVLLVADSSTVKSIRDPRTASGERAVFRFARFGTGKADVLFTVLNTRSRKSCYVVQWDTKTWARIGTRRVAHSAATTFAMSHGGDLLAVATASLQICVCDARTLKVLLRIPAAHSFAITALAFDKDDRRLVSASADETCQAIVLPEAWPTAVDRLAGYARDHSQLLAVLLAALLAVLVALFTVHT
ncbi:quinon protein alcohol dehydrogenase-like superfamily [Coemansia mojavensis]|nr:quinon protein alcohol dehydrogenase-like superfamily [Coemansia mojavensis]